MDFLVVRCGCGNAWAVEGRHHSTRCIRCGHRMDLAKASPLWRGETAHAARAVVATLRQQDMEEHAPAWARPHSSSS